MKCLRFIRCHEHGFCVRLRAFLAVNAFIVDFKCDISFQHDNYRMLCLQSTTALFDIQTHFLNDQKDKYLVENFRETTTKAFSICFIQNGWQISPTASNSALMHISNELKRTSLKHTRSRKVWIYISRATASVNLRFGLLSHFNWGQLKIFL